MSILSQAKRPGNKPVIITVAADAGVGKTRFAATFPNPIFIRIEDGMQSIPFDERPDALPLIESQENIPDLWAQLGALITEEHDYQTLVIDSVTALESVFIDHVVKTDPKKPSSINQAIGGYGAGMRKVAADHARVRRAAGILRDKRGMHVVFIAHTSTETVDPPDADSYTRVSLRLGHRSLQPYVDNVDAVALIKLETYHRDTGGDGPGKAFSDGSRIMTLTSSAAHVSKNRFGITEDIQLIEGQNPLLDIINKRNNTAQKGEQQ